MPTGESELQITEIFYSLQGEGLTQGCPTLFIRLTGCSLRCSYCDTAYAYSGGTLLTVDEVLAKAREYAPRFVTVTGGEPLEQPACLSLLSTLCDSGYEVSLETSGVLDLAVVDRRVTKVMDLKTPGSGQVEHNRYENLDLLERGDQVKFVLCDRKDYLWAREKVAEQQLDKRCEVLFSPCANSLEPTVLADWIVQDRLPVRLQIQLHRVLWGDKRER